MVKFCTCGSRFWWSWKKIICFCYSIKILITEYNVLRITKKRKTVLRNCDKACCNLVYITLGGCKILYKWWASVHIHDKSLPEERSDLTSDLSRCKPWVLYRQDSNFWGFTTSLWSELTILRLICTLWNDLEGTL